MVSDAGNHLKLTKGLTDLVSGLLVANVFLVIAGALWFLTAVVLLNQGLEQPLILFQRLWEPLFLPAISLMLVTTVISGLAGWLKTRLKR